MVAGSQGVDIYGNILEGNYNGITLIQQDRGSGTLGPYLLRNVSVEDNTVVRSGRTGAAQDVDDSPCSPAGTSPSRTTTTRTLLGSHGQTDRWHGHSGAVTEWT